MNWCGDPSQLKTGQRLTWEFGIPDPGMLHGLTEVIDELIDKDIIGGLKEAKDTFASLTYNPPSHGTVDTLIHAIPVVNSIMESCAEDDQTSHIQSL